VPVAGGSGRCQAPVEGHDLNPFKLAFGDLEGATMIPTALDLNLVQSGPLRLLIAGAGL
jgi:hypothetical protein